MGGGQPIEPLVAGTGASRRAYGAFPPTRCSQTPAPWHGDTTFTPNPFSKHPPPVPSARWSRPVAPLRGRQARRSATPCAVGLCSVSPCPGRGGVLSGLHQLSRAADWPCRWRQSCRRALARPEPPENTGGGENCTGTTRLAIKVPQVPRSQLYHEPRRRAPRVVLRRVPRVVLWCLVMVPCRGALRRHARTHDSHTDRTCGRTPRSRHGARREQRCCHSPRAMRFGSDDPPPFLPGGAPRGGSGSRPARTDGQWRPS